MYVSTKPVEGQFRIVLVIYRYAGLAEVREANGRDRWLVGTRKNGELVGYTKMG